MPNAAWCIFELIIIAVMGLQTIETFHSLEMRRRTNSINPQTRSCSNNKRTTDTLGPKQICQCSLKAAMFERICWHGIGALWSGDTHPFIVTNAIDLPLQLWLSNGAQSAGNMAKLIIVRSRFVEGEPNERDGRTAVLGTLSRRTPKSKHVPRHNMKPSN